MVEENLPHKNLPDTLATMKRAVLSLVFFLLLTTGCSSPTAAPGADVITVEYSAATQPWLEKVTTCAGQNAVDLKLRASEFQVISDTAMALQIGENMAPGGHAYQIGTEQLEVIVNPKNPVTKLTAPEVRQLFGGETRSWKDINGRDTSVQVWVFAEGEDVEQLFDQKTLQGMAVTTLAHLAAGPAEMVKAVAQDVDSIGILTSHWKSQEVKRIFTTSEEPVLITTGSEPARAVLETIDCLQQ